jgi:hypothetical protein
LKKQVCNIFEFDTFKGAYWISSISSFVQYCDSNIGLVSIAPPLVIALPTLREQRCLSYTLLKAIANYKGTIIAPSRS